MFPIVGLVVVFGMVFGGFVLAGGHFEVLLEAAPMEFMMIGGAAFGALIISNDMNGLKAVGGGFGKVMTGPKWNRRTTRTCWRCSSAHQARAAIAVGVKP